MEAPGAAARLDPLRPGEASRAARLFAWGALAAILLVVYGRVLGYPFLRWDDTTAVTDNPFLSPPSWTNLGRVWSAPWAGLYVPASFTVLWIEARISALLGGGPDPRVFHLGVFLLHGACAGVVLHLLLRLVGDLRAAFLGALLFAIHPLQTESVAWITETRGVLATLFGLLALAVHVGGSPTMRRDVAATALFLLALLSKPSAVAVPVVALLVDRFVLDRPLRRVLPLLAVWCAMVLAVLLVTKSQQSGPTIRFETPLVARPLIAGDALAFYLEKLAWPFGLVADYGRKPAWLMQQPIYRFHWLVPVGLAAALACLPHRRTWLVAYALFVAGVLPVLGLVSFNFQDISTVGDRYVHLAMLGPALALAAGIARCRGPVALAVAATALVALAGISWRQAGFWRDTDVLFRRTFEVNDRSYIACVHIGVGCANAGRPDEAATWYERALALEPGYPVAAGNLGKIRLDRGDLDGAIELFRQTVRGSPDYPYARQDLAIALVQRGMKATGDARKRDWQEAEAVLRETVRMQPGFHGGHLTLGQLLFVTGRIEEARSEFAQALDILGTSADAHQGLALCYEKLGDRARAAEHAQAAARLRGGG